jgi:hypothetical protein
MLAAIMRPAYWGETHLRTSCSPDAGLVADRLGPDDAFRFARGEKLLSSTGQPVRLDRSSQHHGPARDGGN